MGKYTTLAEQIIFLVGGKDNVEKLTHCATRLRFNLRDKTLIRESELKSTPGVLGTARAMGIYQVIIGNAVSEVYKTILDEQIGDLEEVQPQSTAEGSKSAECRQGNPLLRAGQNMIAAIAAIIAPVFPAIIASGLINALLVILTKTNVIGTESTTYTILFTVGKVAFYFLPVFCGYTAAKHFGCNPIYGLFLACLMIHPNIVELLGGEGAVDLFGLPVYKVGYTSSLIPIILTVWVLSYLERLVDKHLHKNLKHTVKPVIIIFVMLIITFVITGPAGTVAGSVIAEFILLIYEKVPFVGVVFVSTMAPFLVLTGSHLALLPVALASFEAYGYDMLLYVAFIGMNFSQVGISLAVALKAKTKELKGIAIGTCLTAVTGITEPSLYGIALRLKKPLYATFIACFANGLWCAAAKVKVFVIAGPNMFTFPVLYMDEIASIGNIINAGIAILITLVVSFGATWLLGFDENEFEVK